MGFFVLLFMRMPSLNPLPFSSPQIALGLLSGGRHYSVTMWSRFHIQTIIKVRNLLRCSCLSGNLLSGSCHLVRNFMYSHCFTCPLLADEAAETQRGQGLYQGHTACWQEG